MRAEQAINLIRALREDFEHVKEYRHCAQNVIEIADEAIEAIDDALYEWGES